MDSTDTTAALGSLKKDHKNSQIIHRNSSELNGNSRKQSAQNNLAEYHRVSIKVNGSKLLNTKQTDSKSQTQEKQKVVDTPQFLEKRDSLPVGELSLDSQKSVNS